MVRTTKTRNGETWTEARYRSFIVSALRKASSRWGPKNACKRDARHHEKLPNKQGRLVFHSKCNGCGVLIPEVEASVDHVQPVIDPAVGFISWDVYVERLFCEKDGFQVLCKCCHDNKTKQEREIAKERKHRERV